MPVDRHARTRRNYPDGVPQFGAASRLGISIRYVRSYDIAADVNPYGSGIVMCKDCRAVERYTSPAEYAGIVDRHLAQGCHSGAWTC